MKQDVREGGEEVEYLNDWTTEATLELLTVFLCCKTGSRKQLFSTVFPSWL